MKTWNIGLVGAGYWSENHLKAWQRSARARVVACCDLDKGRAQARAETFGIAPERCFGSLDEMLACGGGIDAVDIVTGPDSHRDLVGRAVAVGLPILCQKPFAPDAETAEEMVGSAEAAGVPLMVTENWRWMEPIQAVRAVLDRGTLGRIQVVRYRNKRYATPLMAPNQPLSQPYFRTMPRLLFFEMGVHWYDTWRFLFGMPERLYAEFGKVSSHVLGEDNGVVILSHADGFYGHLDASWASREELNGPDDAGSLPFVEEIVIEGDRATLRMTPTGRFRVGRLELVDHAGIVSVLREDLLYDTVESITRLQAHFIDCLESRLPFKTSGADNLETLRLTFATYESARDHRAVTFTA